MWTPTTREPYSRRAMRYQSDLTDAEWRVIWRHIPSIGGANRDTEMLASVALGGDSGPKHPRLRNSRLHKKHKIM